MVNKDLYHHKFYEGKTSNVQMYLSIISNVRPIWGDGINPWKEEVDKNIGGKLDNDINSQSQCSQRKEWGTKCQRVEK